MAGAKEKEQPNIRKILRTVLVAVAFVLGIVLLVSTVTAFFVFRLKRFELEGNTGYSQAQIEAASGIEPGSNLLFLNLKQAARQIEETLPNLVDVEVRRKLPNTLVISFDETTMAYAVKISEVSYVVTNSGYKVLHRLPEAPPNTILVHTAVTPVQMQEGTVLSFVNDRAQPDTTLTALLALSAAISESGATGVNEISAENLQNLYFIYDGRVLVKLGDASDLQSKLTLFVKTMAEENAIDRTHSGILNLTVSNQAYFYQTKLADIPELAAYLPSAAPDPAESEEDAKEANADADADENVETDDDANTDAGGEEDEEE